MNADIKAKREAVKAAKKELSLTRSTYAKKRALNAVPLWAFLAVILLFVAAVGVGIFVISDYDKELKSSISKEQSTLDDYNQVKRNYDTLRSKYFDIYSEYLFFHDGACIVSSSGSGYAYHHYDCYHLKNVSGVYIYNTENAEAKGYTPCRDCWG